MVEGTEYLDVHFSIKYWSAVVESQGMEGVGRISMNSVIKTSRAILKIVKSDIQIQQTMQFKIIILLLKFKTKITIKVFKTQESILI